MQMTQSLFYFINEYVWRDNDAGVWRFMGRCFRREGQACKAARIEYRRLRK